MGALDLLRKSLSNPAWFKSTVANKAIREPRSKELEQLVDFTRNLDRYTEPLTPEQYFALQKSLTRQRPEPLEGIQERLEGFSGGGLARMKDGGSLEAVEQRRAQLIEALSNPALSPEDRLLIEKELLRIDTERAEEDAPGGLQQLMGVLKQRGLPR